MMLSENTADIWLRSLSKKAEVVVLANMDPRISNDFKNSNKWWE